MLRNITQGLRLRQILWNGLNTRFVTWNVSSVKRPGALKYEQHQNYTNKRFSCSIGSQMGVRGGAVGSGTALQAGDHGFDSLELTKLWPWANSASNRNRNNSRNISWG